MENKIKQMTISDFTLKVAAGVITTAIIGLGTTGFIFVTDKVSKDEFEKHCIENERKHSQLQQQVNQQLEVNAELLKALNRMEVKIQEVKTNTEWLIKERDGK